MKNFLSMFGAKVAGMCSAWCGLGTHELLVWYVALPMAMGQRIPLTPGVKEDSGCRSSWLPLVEAFGWPEAPGCSADGFCSDALELGLNFALVEGTCRGFSREKYLWQTITGLICFLRSINIPLMINEECIFRNEKGSILQSRYAFLQSGGYPDPEFLFRPLSLLLLKLMAAFILGR